MEKLRRHFIESVRKNDLEKMYQQKRRMVISSGIKQNVTTNEMDFESGESTPQIKDFDSLSKLSIRCLKERDYKQAAEHVASIRIIFATDIHNLDFEGLDRTGIIPELVERIGLDMLENCPALIDGTLQ